MATYSSILVWKIPWTEDLGSLQSTGVSKELGMNKPLNNNSLKRPSILTTNEVGGGRVEAWGRR